MMRLNGSDPGSPAACDKKRPRRYAVRIKKNIMALAARNNGLWSPLAAVGYQDVRGIGFEKRI